MILLFTPKSYTKNIATELYEEILDLKIPEVTEFAEPLQQSIITFFAPTEQVEASCNYLLDIEALFPFWMKQSNKGTSNLILMTKEYYNWLACNSPGEVSVLNLEKLIDIDEIPDNLLKYKLFSYINSFPTEKLATADNPSGNIDPLLLRRLFDNIKINLYGRKGTEESFRSILSDIYGIPAENVSISYPKRYILRLNGGRYDWMRNDTAVIGEYSTNPASFNPQLVGSYLNHSVIQNNDLWNEFSYVLNITGISAEIYRETVRPLVHPAGTKDFYDVNYELFNNANDNSNNVRYELPVVGNYAFYNLFSSESLFGCCGCSGISAGSDPWPSHVFPNWDTEINAKYYSGMTFGQIQIGDFIKLTPADGYTYVNLETTCNNC